MGIEPTTFQSEVIQIGSYLRDAGPMAHNPNLYDPRSPQAFHSSVAERSNRYLEGHTAL